MSAAVPRVSVIVPTSNRQALLRETLDSIFAQDFADFELIVVDNDSADGTEAYLRGHADPRLRYFRNANHGVPAVNRNLGVRHARAPYVAFCDDDDLWLPQKLSRQLAALEASPRAGLCFTNGFAFRDGVVLPEPLVAGKKHLLRRGFAGLLMENTIPSCSVMLRRAALEEVGPFDEARELVAVEDWELWLRVARRYPMAFVDEPLVRYRLHASMTARPSQTALRNETVILGVARKLGVSALLAGPALAYQRAKRAWFLFQGR